MPINKRRLKKLEQQLVGDSITIRLKDGKTASIQSKRLPEVFQDLIAERDTPETRLVLAAESSNEEGRMIELMQAIHRSGKTEEGSRMIQ